MSASDCPNCDTPRGAGEYCSACGQRNRHTQLRARDLSSDVVEQVLEWRLPWPRTVFDLCWRPGTVALDYVLGKRARYVNPVKYCFVVVAVAIAFGTFFEGGIIEPYQGQVAYVDLPANLLALFAIPVQVAILHVAFLSASRTVAEIAVLCLYITGQVVLLFQALLVIAPAPGPLSYGLIGFLVAIGVFAVKDFFRTRVAYAAVMTIITFVTSMTIVFGMQSFLLTGGLPL